MVQIIQDAVFMSSIISKKNTKTVNLLQKCHF